MKVAARVPCVWPGRCNNALYAGVNDRLMLLKGSTQLALIVSCSLATAECTQADLSERNSIQRNLLSETKMVIQDPMERAPSCCGMTNVCQVLQSFGLMPVHA